MDKNAIEVNHLTKVYHLYKKPRHRLVETFSLSRKCLHTDFYALKDVSFNIKEGECFGIIGKNGSGKSTMLKILTGVLTETEGIVLVNGRISALLELGAGFNMEYTGIENIYLNGDIMGYSKAEMDERLPKIVEFADIGDHINQPVKTYSSGMFVRLAFAVAINVDPEILIVDEALSVGDAFFQLKCYKKFEEFKKNGKTIVFVTHDLSSVLKYCDRVMVLNNGEKIEEGNSREMVDLYKQILVDINREDVIANAETVQGKIKTNVSVSEKVLDYGTKAAEIVELNVYDKDGNGIQQFEKFDMLTVKMRVHFNEEIHDPIFAITFKDIKGTEIAGTNNLYEGLEGFIARPGEEYWITFEQSIPFQAGSYFLSMGCTGIDPAGAFTVYQRLYDVIQISIVSDKYTVGFCDLNTKITINSVAKSN